MDIPFHMLLRSLQVMKVTGARYGASSLDHHAARKRLRGVFKFLDRGFYSSLQADENEADRTGARGGS